MRLGIARALGPGFVVVASATACADTGGVECACADPTVRIAIPGDRAASVVGVHLSGAACASATIACAQHLGSGCLEYAFRGAAIGSCSVDVQFDAGSADFLTTLSFVRYPCCSGVYAQLPAGSTIAAPEQAGDGGVPGDGGVAE